GRLRGTGGEPRGAAPRNRGIQALRPAGLHAECLVRDERDAVEGAHPVHRLQQRPLGGEAGAEAGVDAVGGGAEAVRAVMAVGLPPVPPYRPTALPPYRPNRYLTPAASSSRSTSRTGRPITPKKSPSIRSTSAAP